MAKKQSSIRESEATDAAGVDRYFEPEQPVKPAAPTWENLHKRWTFHAPVELLEALEAEAKRSGRTKNAVAVALLREGLHLPEKEG